MTAHYAHPLDGGTGAHAIKIAAAAQDAVKHLAHFALGAGDIDRIISQTSYGSLSITERILMTRRLAQDIAKAWLDKPHARMHEGAS